MVEQNWHVWLTQDMNFATKQLLTDGKVSHMFVAHIADRDELIVVPLFLRSAAEKAGMYGFLKVLCVAFDVIGFSLIAEAWVRMIETRIGESAAERSARVLDGPLPSEAEDRKEIIAVTLVYRDDGGRQTLTRMAEIVRNTTGKPISTSPIDMPEDASGDGAVPDILPETRPTPEQQTVAKKFVDQLSHLNLFTIYPRITKP
jgi:hypothetical protein